MISSNPHGGCIMISIRPFLSSSGGAQRIVTMVVIRFPWDFHEAFHVVLLDIQQETLWKSKGTSSEDPLQIARKIAWKSEGHPLNI